MQRKRRNLKCNSWPIHLSRRMNELPQPSQQRLRHQRPRQLKVVLATPLLIPHPRFQKQRETGFAIRTSTSMFVWARVVCPMMQSIVLLIKGWGCQLWGLIYLRRLPYTCMFRKETGLAQEKARDCCAARKVSGWAWAGFSSYNTHVNCKSIFAACAHVRSS